VFFLSQTPLFPLFFAHTISVCCRDAPISYHLLLGPCTSLPFFLPPPSLKVHVPFPLLSFDCYAHLFSTLLHNVARESRPYSFFFLHLPSYVTEILSFFFLILWYEAVHYTVLHAFRCSLSSCLRFHTALSSISFALPCHHVLPGRFARIHLVATCFRRR